MCIDLIFTYRMLRASGLVQYSFISITKPSINRDCYCALFEVVLSK